MESSTSPARGKKEEEKVTCSICLEDVEEGGARALTWLPCGHRFHADCVGSAFTAKGRMECPNCRHISGNWPSITSSSQEYELGSEEMDTTQQAQMDEQDEGNWQEQDQMNEEVEPQWQELVEQMNEQIEEAEDLFAPYSGGGSISMPTQAPTIPRSVSPASSRLVPAHFEAMTPAVTTTASESTSIQEIQNEVNWWRILVHAERGRAQESLLRLQVQEQTLLQEMVRYRDRMREEMEVRVRAWVENDRVRIIEYWTNQIEQERAHTARYWAQQMEHERARVAHYVSFLPSSSTSAPPQPTTMVPTRVPSVVTSLLPSESTSTDQVALASAAADSRAVDEVAAEQPPHP